MGCQQGLAVSAWAALPLCMPVHNRHTCTLPLRSRSAGDFGDTAVQGQLVHQLRYLASVVTQNFTSFGELLAMPKRFAEISGVCSRVGLAAFDTAGQVVALAGRCTTWSLQPATVTVSAMLSPLPGGITRVSEALEVIDKSARLDAATASAAARATSTSATSDGQPAAEDDGISFA